MKDKVDREMEIIFLALVGIYAHNSCKGKDNFPCSCGRLRTQFRQGYRGDAI